MSDAEGEASLVQLRNIGPVSARMLVASGVADPHALRTMGAVAAFRRVLFHRGAHVSTNLLWALEGALRNERWDRLTSETRARLLAELDTSDDVSDEDFI